MHVVIVVWGVHFFLSALPVEKMTEINLIQREEDMSCSDIFNNKGGSEGGLSEDYSRSAIGRDPRDHLSDSTLILFYRRR